MSNINTPIDEGYYTTEIKAKRDKHIVAVAPDLIPKHHLFSEKDAKKKMNDINIDIYEGTKKEKAKHDFDKKMYFKIFGGVAITAATITYFDKIKKFFRKH